jgi:hypothetical protein
VIISSKFGFNENSPEHIGTGHLEMEKTKDKYEKLESQSGCFLQRAVFQDGIYSFRGAQVSVEYDDMFSHVNDVRIGPLCGWISSASLPHQLFDGLNISRDFGLVDVHHSGRDMTHFDHRYWFDHLGEADTGLKVAEIWGSISAQVVEKHPGIEPLMSQET